MACGCGVDRNGNDVPVSFSADYVNSLSIGLPVTANGDVTKKESNVSLFVVVLLVILFLTRNRKRKKFYEKF